MAMEPHNDVILSGQNKIYYTKDSTPPASGSGFQLGDIMVYVGTSPSGFGWRLTGISGTTLSWSAISGQVGAATVLSGSTDAINPHVSGSYLVTTAGVDAMTLAAPTSGTDDGVTITITSTTANAHTLTATGLLKTGSASVNLATFAAFAGAGLTLRAYQGLWYVDKSVGVTFS